MDPTVEFKMYYSLLCSAQLEYAETGAPLRRLPVIQSCV
jgi:hypothetical protein